MRVRFHEGGIELSESLVKQLAAIHPEGRIDRWRFGFSLYEDDPRLVPVLELLRQHGREPWTHESGRIDGTRHFLLSKIREYDASDFVSVPFVTLQPIAEGNGLFRDEAGQIKMIDGEFPRRAEIVATPLSWIVVPERVKAALEREAFRGLQFRATVLVGGHPTHAKMRTVSWSRYGEPWWEMTSDLQLLPMSPAMDLRDEAGNPIRNADCINGCVAYDGLFSTAEYRYRAADLAPLMPLDFAYTAERFGPPAPPDVEVRRLIASARFREFCVSYKWRCDWIPVRVD